MVVTGESFDYGPYRFLPRYDSGFVAAYFDSSGLYAFGRQARAVLRNLARLGEALTLVGDATRLSTALGGFPHELSVARARLLHRRLGLEPLGYDDDQRFSSVCWDFLAASGMPYDQFFFDWFGRRSERGARGGRPSRLALRASDIRQPARPARTPHPDRSRSPRQSLLSAHDPVHVGHRRGRASLERHCRARRLGPVRAKNRRHSRAG